MGKSIKISLLATGALIVGVMIFIAGIFAGRFSWSFSNFGRTGMMGWKSSPNNLGFSMMGGRGMMGAYSTNAPAAKPITVDQARGAAEGYLKGLNIPDLEIKEIMVFENNAYVRITEKSTGIGAMELLVDPSSLNVFPEYGPNMMWNLKYGHMSGGNFGMMGGFGMMGRSGMMGRYQGRSPAVSATMPVTAEQAVKVAQQYLDQQFPGTQADTQPDAFYGYYTIDILKDGKPTGMLSVNGFNQQVFYHTWHGSFISQSE
jgi:hypothetical protein